MEAQEQRRKDYEAEIKANQAETQRISAVQAGMTEQQIQDIAMGVVAAALESNDNMVMMNQQREMPEMQPEMLPQGEMQ